MSTPILNYQPLGGVPITIPPVPPIYSQTGATSLIEGQDYVDVVFGSVQTNADWVLVACEVENVTDTDPLNIWPGIITEKTVGGFRLQLNGIPDSGNYYLIWAVSGINITPGPASTYYLTGPHFGDLGEDAILTVMLPPSTFIDGSAVITLDDGGAGGTFTPPSVTLATESRSYFVAYTPASYGVATISATNDFGLIDPDAITFTVVVTTYTLSGPSSGMRGSPSTDFTVALPVGGAVAGTITVTPHDGESGTFIPSTVALTTASPSATFTYTAATTGTKTISVTNDGDLTDPADLSYLAEGIALLNNLVSYWEMDEVQPGSVNVPRVDSHGSNNLDDPTYITQFPAIISNGGYLSGANYLEHASNSTLQVTGDFTFSLWVRPDALAATFSAVLSKDAVTANRDYLMVYDGTNGFQFYVMDSGGSIFTQAEVGAPAGSSVFVHIVAWYDSADSKTRIRINDATTYVASSGITTPNASTTAFRIGATAGTPAGYFTGLIDEVGFWKRLLTAAEITALYNGGAGLPYSSFTT